MGLGGKFNCRVLTYNYKAASIEYKAHIVDLNLWIRPGRVQVQVHLIRRLWVLKKVKTI